MRIGGCTFLNRNIIINTKNEFVGNYGGRTIYISTDHGLGKPSNKQLKRFNIDVVTIDGNCYDVQTWKDYSDIKHAISFALKGAMLWKPKKTYRKKKKNGKPVSK